MKCGKNKNAGAKAGESVREDSGLVESLQRWIEEFRIAPPDWSDVFRGLVPTAQIAGRVSR